MSDEWIVVCMGIYVCYFVVLDVMMSDFVFEVLCCVIEVVGVDLQLIDLIIVVILIFDFVFLSIVCLLQNKFGIKNGGVVFDVQVVCLGFVYVVVMVDSFICSGQYCMVFVVGVEMFLCIFDFKDCMICVLFGDGVGVVILFVLEELGVFGSVLYVDGSYLNILCMLGNVNCGVIDGSVFLYMDG